VLSCRLLRRSDCTPGLNAGTRATPDLPSLNPHVIPDRLHPLDATGNLDRLIDVGLGIDEAAQLNYTLEGFDVDFGGLQGGFIENCRFDLRGNHSVIDIFSRPLLL
jgi:hypothetical protein